MKIAIEEKSSRASKAAIKNLRLQVMVTNKFKSRVTHWLRNPSYRKSCNGNRPE